MPELWSIELSADLETLCPRAQRLERDGWTGISLVDSQNMSPEPYVALSAIAAATSSLKLGIGVSNPTTRHPALAASAATTLNRLSKGRFTLDIGRGDSANATIGLAPSGVRQFERYISLLRAYLKGEPVDMEEAASFAFAKAKPLSSLGLAGEHQTSSLLWMRDKQWMTDSGSSETDDVTLQIVGSGLKVLDIAARYADRVMLAVGANPDRIGWAIKTVKEARAAAGLNVDVPIGAYISMVANEDPAEARRHIRSTLTTTSRFSAMHGKVSGPANEHSTKVLESIKENYDMTQHGQAGASHRDLLDEQFINEHGIAGDGDYCASRLLKLTALGIDKFVVFPVGTNADPDVVEQNRSILASSVIPVLRE